MKPVFSGEQNMCFVFLNGKHYVLDGISGVFEHWWERRSKKIYVTGYAPYTPEPAEVYWLEELRHVPDEVGKQSEEYQKTRAELGDDWATDLTESETFRYVDIATELGYKEEGNNND